MSLIPKLMVSHRAAPKTTCQSLLSVARRRHAERSAHRWTSPRCNQDFGRVLSLLKSADAKGARLAAEALLRKVPRRELRGVNAWWWGKMAGRWLARVLKKLGLDWGG